MKDLNFTLWFLSILFALVIVICIWEERSSMKKLMLKGFVVTDAEELDTIDMSSNSDCNKIYKTPPSNEALKLGKEYRKISKVSQYPKKLQNVLVYIKLKDNQKFTDSESKTDIERRIHALNMRACLYEPRVMGVRAGSTLQLQDNDTTKHFPYFKYKKSEKEPTKLFHVAMNTKQKNLMLKYKEEQPIHITDSNMPWMHAHIGVFDHPFFAVTDANGKYEIDVSGLEPGIYEIAFWHELWGETTKTVPIKVKKNPAPRRSHFFKNVK